MHFLNKEKNLFILNNQKYHLNSQFVFYLARLIEGDSSIIVPFLINNKKGSFLYLLENNGTSYNFSECK